MKEFMKKHYKELENFNELKFVKSIRKEKAREIFEAIDHTSFIEHLNDKQLEEYEEIKKKHSE